ncbi:unnamed protein product [Adineta steineri]|uniref:Uncharacterized protein n=1 Tax=Adineta steineri TaxID=433720 RepID=A0A813NWI6_9BILA|nr:unnamed protein product [Adineta steineri]CAF0739913.1 unnamed protein product [Adineta steineri]CAF0771373.1 unnamed protein product [Adineta steineri]CAF3841836.1 unnamed protein product [Adineta steineri]
MKLWCLLVIFLIVIISTASAYTDDDSNEFDSPNHLEQISSNSPLLSVMKRDRLIVKRSQRNANILYRYCRQSGQPREFCLKYAVRMIFATGH